MGCADGRLGIDVDDLIVDARVEDIRHEIRADALDLVRSRYAGRQERRLRRLHGHDLDARFVLSQYLPGAGDCAAGAYASDEYVDPAISVFPELDSGGPPVHL